jgi:DNA-binding response OmpR family regulator
MTDSGPRTQSLSVLVVDDLEDTANTTAAVLAMSGHAVRTAYSGEEAVRAADADPPDVVLFDIGMPGMDGWELARRLREAAVVKRPLLVAVTAAATDADRKKSDEAGVDLHLVKPVDPAALVGLVRRFGRVVAPTTAPPGA